MAIHGLVCRKGAPVAIICPRLGVGGWHESDEGETGFHHDARRYVVGTHDERRPKHVRREMFGDDEPVRDAQRTGGFDKLALPQRCRLRPHDACEARPVHENDRDDDDLEARTKDPARITAARMTGNPQARSIRPETPTSAAPGSSPRSNPTRSR